MDIKQRHGKPAFASAVAPIGFLPAGLEGQALGFSCQTQGDLE